SGGQHHQQDDDFPHRLFLPALDPGTLRYPRRSPRRPRFIIRAAAPNVHGSASPQVTTSFTRGPSPGAEVLTMSPRLCVNPPPGASRSWSGVNMVPMNRISPSGYWWKLTAWAARSPRSRLISPTRVVWAV